MKTLCLGILLLFSITAQADLPYMPLKIRLQSTQSQVYEGEKITFKVWIININKDNTYPILLPDRQNTGKKLFYLKVLDKTKHHTHVVALENPNLNNRLECDKERYPEVMQLGPTDSVSFTLHWNAHDTLDTENHHTFNTLLTAGNYSFQGFYSPKGTIIGDSLYNFISYSFQPTQDKLLFLEEGNPTNTVEIVIKPSPKEIITIEGENFKVKREHGGKINEYYINDTVLAKTVHFHSNGKKQLEFASAYQNGDPGSLLFRTEYFENGSVRDHYFYNKNYCPSIIFRRHFSEEGIKKLFIDQLSNGVTIEKNYNNKGQIILYIAYSADGDSKTEYSYSSKTGKLLSKKEYKNPCQNVEFR